MHSNDNSTDEISTSEDEVLLDTIGIDQDTGTVCITVSSRDAKVEATGIDRFHFHRALFAEARDNQIGRGKCCSVSGFMALEVLYV